MKIADLRNKLKERVVDWYTVPGSSVRVKIKTLLPVDLEKRAKRKEANPKGKLDWEAYRDLVLNETILEYEGITEDDGVTPVAANPLNNRTLLDSWPEFRAMWGKASGFVTVEPDNFEEEAELPNS